MRKALIVQGNTTTTGGLVLGGSAVGMTDHGRPFALHGDEATCGRCKGTFKIVGTAARRCYHGRAGVIEGDLVLSPCGENRVLADQNPGCFYHTDGDAAVASSAEIDIASALSFDTTFDEQIRAIAPAMNDGYPYFIVTSDGRSRMGRTDSSRVLPRIATHGADEYIIFLG